MRHVLRLEGATIQGLARQLGTSWNTVWSQVQSVLTRAANEPVQFENVQLLGVDEPIWHHRDPPRRRPKVLTGMVKLARSAHPTARLLDPDLGRSRKVYGDWLDQRGDTFRDGNSNATLDQLQGYQNAIDDQLEDANCLLDAFHIVKFAGNLLMTFAAGSSKRPSATAAGPGSLSTASATHCARAGSG